MRFVWTHANMVAQMSPTSFVKVDQEVMLFHKPSKLCATCLKQIVTSVMTWLMVSFGHPWALAWNQCKRSGVKYDGLGVRKVCSRWIPYDLTDDRQKIRVEWCREIHRKFGGGHSNLEYDIVTGYNSWIYSYEPAVKRQSAVWVFEEEHSPTKAVRSRGVSEQMRRLFLRANGSCGYGLRYHMRVEDPVMLNDIRPPVCQKSSSDHVGFGHFISLMRGGPETKGSI